MSNTPDPEKCGSKCRDAEFTYFGMQGWRGDECWCDKKLTHYVKLDKGECKIKCPGDSPKICGGPWKNSLYLIKKEKDDKFAPRFWQTIQISTHVTRHLSRAEGFATPLSNPN